MARNILLQSKKKYLTQISYLIFKDFIYLFLETGEGRERERSTDVKEKHDHFPHMCALNGNGNRNLMHVPQTGI